MVTETEAPTEVTRSGVDRRAIPDAALELADLLSTVAVGQAVAIQYAVMAGDDHGRRFWDGQAAAHKAIAERIADRIAALTGGA